MLCRSVSATNVLQHLGKVDGEYFVTMVARSAGIAAPGWSKES